MTPLWVQRIQEAWNAPTVNVIRRLGHTVLRLAGRIAGMLIWQLRLHWARLNGRSRIAVVLAALILTTSSTKTLAPSVSAAAQGLAVLAVAGIGILMMLASPFRRRR